MKCVLKWLLSPYFNFAFMPQDVQNLFQQAALEDAVEALQSGATPSVVNALAGLGLMYGVDFIGNQTAMNPAEWRLLSGNEATINFINQAIEWENVVFFTYSYFWDYPLCWDFIRQIQHDDKTRQAFLRAGAARVVLTVRQGWEQLWTNYVNTGKITLPTVGSPLYLTIAKQIEAYDSTNYPGIPAANPDGGGLIDDDTPQVGTTCSVDLHKSPSSVIIPVANSSGFAVGATAIIDNWDVDVDPTTGIGIQETQTITAVTVSPPSITVQALQHGHTLANGPFPIVQAGAKGVLIGEWFEYAPTSGTDIGVTINPSGPMA